MVRASYGNSDHPDPVMFLLIFRLLSTYSLVKPPPGSNVTGCDLLEALMDADKTEEQSGLTATAKTNWENIKNRIINNAERTDESERHSDTFDPTNLQDNFLHYFAGFSAKKALWLYRCSQCRSKILNQNEENPLTLVSLRNYYNALHVPSDEFFRFIQKIESKIVEVVGTDGADLTPNTFFEIADRLVEDEDEEPLMTIGCEKHGEELTKKLLEFYLVMRLNLICKEKTQLLVKKSKNVELRKTGKLIEAPKPNLKCK